MSVTWGGPINMKGEHSLFFLIVILVVGWMVYNRYKMNTSFNVQGAILGGVADSDLYTTDSGNDIVDAKGQPTLKYQRQFFQ